MFEPSAQQVLTRDLGGNGLRPKAVRLSSDHTGASKEIWQLRSSPRVLAPDWAARIRRVPAAAWLLIAVLVLVALLHDPPANASWIVLIAVLGVLGGPIVLKFLNTRVRIAPDFIECQDSLRRTSRCERGTLAKLIRVRITTWLGPRFALTRILLLNREGRVAASLRVDAWQDNQLRAISQRLGMSVQDGGTLSAREISKVYPGAASRWLRDGPIAIAALIIVLAVLVALAVALTPAHR